MVRLLKQRRVKLQAVTKFFLGADIVNSALTNAADERAVDLIAVVLFIFLHQPVKDAMARVGYIISGVQSIKNAYYFV